MLNVHLIGIIKITKNSVWHQQHSYYREQLKLQQQQQTITTTTSTTTTAYTIWKNCRCLRKKRKFLIEKIQNLWFGSNDKNNNNKNNNPNYNKNIVIININNILNNNF